MLLKFGMLSLKPVATPLSSQFKLRSSTDKKTDEEKDFMEKIPYANIVGSVMYAMVCTRPDLSHAIMFSVYLRQTLIRSIRML